MVKVKIFDCFSGETILNYTESFETSAGYREILADQTTPDAVLLAEKFSVYRMYSNGTAEAVVGKVSTRGCV